MTVLVSAALVVAIGAGGSSDKNNSSASSTSSDSNASSDSRSSPGASDATSDTPTTLDSAATPEDALATYFELAGNGYAGDCSQASSDSDVGKSCTTLQE